MTFIVFNLSMGRWYIGVVGEDKWLAADGSLTQYSGQSCRKSLRDAIRLIKKHHRVKRVDEGWPHYKFFEVI